jgi:hypothetical protein
MAEDAVVTGQPREVVAYRGTSMGSVRPAMAACDAMQVTAQIAKFTERLLSDIQRSSVNGSVFPKYKAGVAE